MVPHLQCMRKSLRLLEAAQDSFSLPEDIGAVHPGAVLSLLRVKPLTGQSVWPGVGVERVLQPHASSLEVGRTRSGHTWPASADPFLVIAPMPLGETPACSQDLFGFMPVGLA